MSRMDRLYKWMFALWCVLLLSGCQSKQEWPDNRYCLLLEENPHMPSGRWSIQVQMPVSHLLLDVCANPVLYDVDFESVDTAETALGTCLLVRLKRHAAIEFYKISVGCEQQRLVLLKNNVPIGYSYSISHPMEEGMLLFYLEEEDMSAVDIQEEINKTIILLRKLKNK